LAAKKYSVSPSSDNNGDIGWFFEETLNEQYKNELKKINKGDFTAPILISESAVILKIDDIKITKNTNLDLEKIKDEIILNKKDEKLRLFSRSHFSKSENEILVTFL
jgi:parvulin-like peptidyl-prolyl isomerase